MRKLLIIGYVWPEPSSSAAGRRMLDIILIFKKANWEITFASASVKTPYSTHLESLDVDSQTVQLNCPSFDDFVRKLNPQVVIFDRFITEEQFSWRVESACPTALRVLDTEDLHFLRHAREKAVTLKREVQYSDYLNEFGLRELSAICRSDLSLIISQEEMKLLLNQFNIQADILHYLPFFIANQKTNNDLLYFDSRKDFIFIGNFRHAPNIDAVLWLKETIWPLIRKNLPTVNIHIYGAYCPDKVKYLHSDSDGFLVHGRADDAQAEVSKARVSLIPLRFGAGLKGKVFESIENGTPVVTTSIGAEGILDSLSEAQVVVANQPEAFATLAVNYYQDQLKWLHAQNVLLHKLKASFSWDDYADKFISTVEGLMARQTAHRHANLIGQMLRHHQHRSHKYMSLWIEEKQRSRSLSAP